MHTVPSRTGATVTGGGPSGTAWKTRLHAVGRPVVSIAVLLAIIWTARTLVDWPQVWVAILDMSWLKITTLVLAAEWNIATYLLVMMSAMPGLWPGAWAPRCNVWLRRSSGWRIVTPTGTGTRRPSAFASRRSVCWQGAGTC